MEKVTVEKMVHGGFGLGHLYSGQVVLIPDALPKEELIVTVQEQKKNFSLVHISQILSPHPKRCTPECPYLECGGCDLNHAEYSTQLACKEQILDDLLQRAALDIGSARTPIMGSRKQTHYRQRIRLVCQEGKLGFRKRRSHGIVEIERCLLAEDKLNATLADFRKSPYTGTLISLSEEVELQLDPENEDVILLFHFIRPPRPTDLKTALSLAEELQNVERIFFTGKDFAMLGPYPEGEDRLLGYHYTDVGKRKLDLYYQFEIGGFCQVNLDQNRVMIETVLEFAGIPESVLDLYCGMGNFSIPLAMLGADVSGIEGQGAAIRSAKNNAATAHLNTASFAKKAVHQACKELVQQNRSFTTVLIDPPRQGAPELAEALSKLARRQIIYISCDPATLIRDLKELCNNGFKIIRFQPLDMFPQTHHIETVVLLEKQG